MPSRRCTHDRGARLTTVARMGSVRHPRGRLPRRVYWIRRSVVLGVALLLVFGIGKLLGGTGEDPAAPTSRRAPTSGQQQEEPDAVGHGRSGGPVDDRRSAKGGRAAAPLLPPNGVCADDEVSVLPSVPRAWGAQPILIRLGLTGLQPACTFKVSPESLVVKITSGEDRIWSSQDCPHAINDRRRGGAQRRPDVRQRALERSSLRRDLQPDTPTGRTRASTTCSPRRSARRRPTCSSRSPAPRRRS